MIDELIRDLDEIVDAAADDLRRFAGARLYVTGGTGFVGSWLLRTVVHANRRLGTNIRVDALTRSPEGARERVPDLAGDAAIRLLRGDTCSPVTDGAYDGVIHAATPSTGTMNDNAPDRMLAVIVDGTRAVIRNVVAPNGTIPVLFTSSGAVYGKQPPELPRVPEDYTGAPDCLEPRSAYHEGKRTAELALAIAQSQGAGVARIARLFAFLGPGLPLDAHYAAGNFVRDALAGGPIRVLGDGSPYRSYLYPTDMVAWLFAIFARGAGSRAYNVGSEDAIAIGDLAARVARLAGGGIEVTVARRPSAGTGWAGYVPDCSRIKSELQVRQSVSLDEAIARTIAFHRPDRSGKHASA